MAPLASRARFLRVGFIVARLTGSRRVRHVWCGVLDAVASHMIQTGAAMDTSVAVSNRAATPAVSKDEG
jgi:hypothetical protein